MSKSNEKIHETFMFFIYLTGYGDITLEDVWTIYYFKTK